MNLSDWLNNINYNKDTNVKNFEDYSSFIINRCLSYHADTIHIANELNLCSNITNEMRYHFLLELVEKKKRYAPWVKSDKDKEKIICKIINILQVSSKDADYIYNSLSKSQLKELEDFEDYL